MPSRDWERAELLKVLALYCQLPFGRFDARNRDVIAMASVLDRTPGSVAIKLCNFASLDPEHRRRGVRGMGHASKLDKVVWREHYGNWAELAQESDFATSDSVAEPTVGEGGNSVLALAAQRRGQDFFRRAVLAAHDQTCCVTGINVPKLLRASHIVPWAKRAETQLDPRNGLCLNALHDAAFDKGLFTLTDELNIVLSGELRRAVPERVCKELFGSREGKKIAVPQRFVPPAEFLAFHREHVFVA